MVISKIVTTGTLDHLVEIGPCCLVNFSSSLNKLQILPAQKTLVWVNSAKGIQQRKISMTPAIPKTPWENLHKCDQNSVMTCNV